MQIKVVSAYSTFKWYHQYGICKLTARQMWYVLRFANSNAISSNICTSNKIVALQINISGTSTRSVGLYRQHVIIASKVFSMWAPSVLLEIFPYAYSGNFICPGLHFHHTNHQFTTQLNIPYAVERCRHKSAVGSDKYYTAKSQLNFRRLTSTIVYVPHS